MCAGWLAKHPSQLREACVWNRCLVCGSLVSEAVLYLDIVLLGLGIVQYWHYAGVVLLGSGIVHCMGFVLLGSLSCTGRYGYCKWYWHCTAKFGHCTGIVQLYIYEHRTAGVGHCTCIIWLGLGIVLLGLGIVRALYGHCTASGIVHYIGIVVLGWAVYVHFTVSFGDCTLYGHCTTWLGHCADTVQAL